MSRALLSPWQAFGRLQQDMSEFFRQVEQGARRYRQSDPSVNIWSGDAGLIVRFAVPGFAAEDFDIEVEAGELTVRAEHADDTGHPEESRLHRDEFAPRKFVRSFALPFEVDSTQTEATYRDGLLTVTLVRPEQEQPRKITVNR